MPDEEPKKKRKTPSKLLIPPRGKYNLCTPEFIEEAVELVTGKSIGEILAPHRSGQGRRREYALLLYCMQTMTPLIILDIMQRYRCNRIVFSGNSWFVHTVILKREANEKFDEAMYTWVSNVRAIVKQFKTTSIKKNVGNVKKAMKRAYAPQRAAKAQEKLDAKKAVTAKRNEYLKSIREDQHKRHAANSRKPRPQSDALGADQPAGDDSTQ